MSNVIGLMGAIGNTPLLKLSKLSAVLGSEIFAKAEFMQPGGSVKDRAALFLVNDADKNSKIHTIVEGTAGNTGIGLAHVCRAKGYKCVIYMPNTQSQEKIDLLRMLGADVRPVPPVPFTDPKNYNHQAKAFAESIEGAVWTNQFEIAPFIRPKSSNYQDVIDSPEFLDYVKLIKATGVKPGNSVVLSAHQMGSCRMSSNPKKGAVGPNGKVYGTSKLYLADASVFPTASGVNPMVTTYSMAYSIAQGIKNDLSKSAKL